MSLKNRLSSRQVGQILLPTQNVGIRMTKRFVILSRELNLHCEACPPTKT